MAKLFKTNGPLKWTRHNARKFTAPGPGGVAYAVTSEGIKKDWRAVRGEAVLSDRCVSAREAMELCDDDSREITDPLADVATTPRPAPVDAEHLKRTYDGLNSLVRTKQGDDWRSPKDAPGGLPPGFACQDPDGLS